MWPLGCSQHHLKSGEGHQGEDNQEVYDNLDRRCDHAALKCQLAIHSKQRNVQWDAYNFLGPKAHFFLAKCSVLISIFWANIAPAVWAAMLYTAELLFDNANCLII